MNELQHIRSMAEMIIQKVDALDGTKTPEVKLRKFSIGNKVYLNDGIGDEVKAIITDVHMYDLDRYRVEFYNGKYISQCWVHEREMRSNPASLPKFRVGDRVKTPNHDGVIISVNLGLQGEQSYEVQLSNKTACIGRYLESSLTLLKTEPKFKVGDKVVWLSDCSETPMTITKVDIDTFNTGNPTVVFPNESGIYYEYWAGVLNEDGCWSRVFGEAALKLYVEPKVEDRVWHSGPPPHIGWWNASYNTGANREMTWRWWNGSQWSMLVFSDQIYSGWIANLASRLDECQDKIEWNDYYPENARVPRINPGV